MRKTYDFVLDKSQTSELNKSNNTILSYTTWNTKMIISSKWNQKNRDLVTDFKYLVIGMLQYHTVQAEMCGNESTPSPPQLWVN